MHKASRRSLINIRKYFLQHHAEDLSERNFQILENLETLPDPGNLIARQGNAGNLGSVLPLGVGANSVLPLGGPPSVLPLLLTSLLVAAISGTAAYTSLMANPPGEPEMIFDLDKNMGFHFLLCSRRLSCWVEPDVEEVLLLGANRG